MRELQHVGSSMGTILDSQGISKPLALSGNEILGTEILGVTKQGFRFPILNHQREKNMVSS